MAFKLYNEEVYMGLETAWSVVADFLIQPGQGTQARKFKSFDQGNPGQLLIGRAGPDGADPTQRFTRPENLPVGTNIGHVAWMAYESVDGSFSQRNAQIYTRYKGYGLGSFHIQTSGMDRFVVEADGILSFPNAFNNRIAVRDGFGTLGYIEIKR